MGFNLKETFKSAKAKNILIITGALILVLAVITGGVMGWQNYNYKKMKKEQLERSYTNLPTDISSGPKRPSQYDVGIDYEKVLQQNKPALVLFYADWCRYCIKFMPIFEEISKKYDGDLVLSKVNVEDKKYEKLVNKVRVMGFPTVILFDPKYDNTVQISNAFIGNVKDLSGEIDQFLRIRKLLDSKK